MNQPKWSLLHSTFTLDMSQPHAMRSPEYIRTWIINPLPTNLLIIQTYLMSLTFIATLQVNSKHAFSYPNLLIIQTDQMSPAWFR